ncbi:hypothetical protein [Methanobacterium formicicum]|uniref:Uncharacterized protein n=1 Tax=Methanobacterium formicicum TaxID=2162 RepID=A0A0S4FLX0_METFO|nr:hypothetical protein [Methanobacterium formicicum]CEL23993.1 hypothetical protein MB9_0345 [Methanobacterium formicicum]
MGRKGFQIPDLILKELSTSQKSGKLLKDKVKEELYLNPPSNFTKAFNRALIKLIESEEIKIVDYDSSKDKRKNKQAFNPDPIVFDSSKRLTRPNINELLKNMETNNDAYYKIKRLFKHKQTELEELYKKRWKFLENRTFNVTTEDIEDKLYDLEYYHDILELLSNFDETQQNAAFEDYYVDSEKADQDLASDVYYLADSLEEKYEDKYMLVRPGEVTAATILLIIVDKFENSKNSKIFFYPISPFQFNDIQFDLDYKSTVYNSNSDIPVEIFLHYHLTVDPSGRMTKNDALYNKGFENPLEVMKEPDIAFEHVIDIISTYNEEEKFSLYGILGKGLSDEPGSIYVFADFYKEIMKINYSDRLKTILGIFKESSRD